MTSVVTAIVISMILALSSSNSQAEDSLTKLMQRMRTGQTNRMAYQETRKLVLMDQPWHGSGFLYSLPPDLLIKEQLLPERLLMGIKGEQMYYFDPANQTRHQSEMTDDNPISLNIGVFRALINADEILLHRLYRTQFSNAGNRWRLSLTPWQNLDAGIDIVISGLNGQQPDSIKITEAEGDISDYSLQPDTTANTVDAEANRLYRELIGD